MSRHDNSMTMNVNLSPQLEVTVKNKVASGRYTNEVVREALRLMAGSRCHETRRRSRPRGVAAWRRALIQP
jgi:putative addiction module CopG family antidote